LFLKPEQIQIPAPPFLPFWNQETKRWH
jgi:hypothetical protein